MASAAGMFRDRHKSSPLSEVASPSQTPSFLGMGIVCIALAQPNVNTYELHMSRVRGSETTPQTTSTDATMS